MRATKYFRNATDMVAFAQAFCNAQKDRWFLRTTLRCDHLINEKRHAIVLVENETIVQRLIVCKTCNHHGNAPELVQKVQELEKTLLNLKNLTNGNNE